MKAIIINDFGNSSVLKLQETPEPVIDHDTVLVQNKSVGVNFVDIYHRTGLYKKPLPFIPGQEGAGIIVQIGSDVKNYKIGDRVAYVNVDHSYADFVKVPVSHLVKLPDFIDFKEGAALMLKGLTSHFLVTSTYPVSQETTLLVHAAAGGVGSLLVQMAKIKGAFVIATTSTEEKVQLVKNLGADVVINYTTTNWVAEVKKLTKNEGVDVVYDSVAKNTFPGSLDCLKPRGLFVLFGQSSGLIENFNYLELTAKGSLFMTRPSISHYIATSEELDLRANDLFNWLRNKKIKLLIDSEFPLEEVAKAHNRLERRQNKGEIILKI